jgi:hypothetical protein
MTTQDRENLKQARDRRDNARRQAREALARYYARRV